MYHVSIQQYLFDYRNGPKERPGAYTRSKNTAYNCTTIVGIIWIWIRIFNMYHVSIQQYLFDYRYVRNHMRIQNTAYNYTSIVGII